MDPKLDIDVKWGIMKNLLSLLLFIVGASFVSAQDSVELSDQYNELEKYFGSSYIKYRKYEGNYGAPSTVLPSYGSVDKFVIGYRSGKPGKFKYESYSFIQPNFWDSGTGVKDSVRTNMYTIQRIFYSKRLDKWFVYLGQEQYYSFGEAKYYIDKERFVIDPTMDPKDRLYSLVIKQGETDLQSRDTYFCHHKHNCR